MGTITCLRKYFLISFFIISAGLMFFLPTQALALDSLCAVVKIEILQELMLERQAFDAHMRINNGLSNIFLENVNVVVTFSDKDGNPVLASSDQHLVDENSAIKFFIRADSDGIAGSSEGWSIDPVGPSSVADLHWLIIPAPGSSNGLESGTLYFVGAKLTYKIGGEEHITEVTPDYIYVKPLPQLQLDYFLTKDVFGDDAFTKETTEPSIPFTLGVRIKNNGAGTARNLKIDSAQPKIKENVQHLLIGFAILGSQVNGSPTSKSLLVDFGDIAPSKASVGRWIMSCSLSGSFEEFTAQVSHSDELGGELTSLMRQGDIHPHFLVKDVLVDLPGRDSICDFLGHEPDNPDNLTIYESDSTDTAVSDLSSSLTFNSPIQSGSEIRYTLSMPPT
ncbi:MAG: hypothetical protein Q7U04_09100, partial [Bacteriovorax sp.]|nr:hypothetical protein [Bacteriovorax sp.]